MKSIWTSFSYRQFAILHARLYSFHRRRSVHRKQDRSATGNTISISISVLGRRTYRACRIPSTGSTTWVEYDGISVVREILGGRASLFELTADGPAGHLEGVGLRLYNPESHQWSLNWANGKTGILGVPTIGEFKNGRGVFVDQESFNDRVILVRNSFMDITPNSARFEQTFSDDAGQTWETNWVMIFTRLKPGRKGRDLSTLPK